jgi:hypothetical protein
MGIGGGIIMDLLCNLVLIPCPITGGVAGKGIGLVVRGHIARG